MMKPFLLVLVMLAGGVSCAHQPPLARLPGDTSLTVAARCLRAFPPQPWRATHTLVASHPSGLAAGVIGVLSTGNEGLHVVLLSPEGLRLFDGLQKHRGSGGLTILRAVPPLDYADFAPRLMADVGAAFLPPAGRPAIGKNATGATVCRWSAPNSDATEVELGPSGPARIRTYRNLHVTRDIELFGAPNGGFFPRMRLVATDIGYTFDITLVDHE